MMGGPHPPPSFTASRLLLRQIWGKCVEGVGWGSGCAILQGDSIVRCQGYFCVEGGCDGTGKGFAVDIDFPARGCVQLCREVQFGKAPDGQKIVEGDVVDFSGSLDVDDAISGMGVHPVKTTAVRGYSDACWDGGMLAMQVDGKVDVNMIGVLLGTITGNAVNGWIERVIAN